jgi:DNA-directed RNA polymerase specialized sigma24 family protein
VEPEEGFAEDPGFVRLEADAEFVRMLSALPDRQRAVLVLRYYADLDDAAVAKTLGCTVQTVRSQASRALAKLRARLVSADGGADAPAAASASTPASAPVTEGRA